MCPFLLSLVSFYLITFGNCSAVCLATDDAKVGFLLTRLICLRIYLMQILRFQYVNELLAWSCDLEWRITDSNR